MMLYLGIDQHARQLTISLRDESGDVIQARQVSTQPEKVQAFFTALTRDCAARASRLSRSWKSAGSTIGCSRCCRIIAVIV